MTYFRPLALVLSIVALAGLSACGDKRPVENAQPVSYETETPSGPKPKPVPKPTDAEMAKVKASFDAAAKVVEEARALRKAGEEAERTAGRDAAMEKYRQAKRLYRQAMQDTEEWIEEDFGHFTADQIDRHLRMYLSERHRWQKEAAGMGKMRD